MIGWAQPVCGIRVILRGWPCARGVGQQTSFAASCIENWRCTVTMTYVTLVSSIESLRSLWLSSNVSEVDHLHAVVDRTRLQSALTNGCVWSSRAQALKAFEHAPDPTHGDKPTMIVRKHATDLATILVRRHQCLQRACAHTHNHTHNHTHARTHARCALGRACRMPASDPARLTRGSCRGHLGHGSVSRRHLLPQQGAPGPGHEQGP